MALRSSIVAGNVSAFIVPASRLFARFEEQIDQRYHHRTALLDRQVTDDLALEDQVQLGVR